MPTLLRRAQKRRKVASRSKLHFQIRRKKTLPSHFQGCLLHLMKVALFLLFPVALLTPLGALPNAVLGALAQHESPLNGEDLTDAILASALWDGSEALPGEWEADAGVATASSGYLKARPKVFGLDALLVRALHRNDRLEEIQITFADAGSFFGYLDQRLPSGMSREDGIVERQKRLQLRKDEFTTLYAKTSEELTAQLTKIDAKPKQSKRGRTRDLRAELSEYHEEKSGLVIHLLEAGDRLIRVSIHKRKTAPKSWLDSSLEELATRERLKALAARVTRSERGDLVLDGVEIVPQGYRPYCGLNTLVMVARYLGLHLDEDWLAVAGKFENTGSAAGSDMLGLYSSVAREARFNLNRKSSYDHETVRRSLRAGMPVIVWRRWDQSRDRLHTKVSRDFVRGRGAGYGRPEEELLPSKKKRSPLHASVIIGYNDERKEVIFLESWEGKSSPRRMPVSEMAHTADLTFAFQP
ncbi:MAG: hypothetical protein ACI9NQ_000062 [Paracoccaceae bacterium]|jgi:hypothetical protein